MARVLAISSILLLGIVALALWRVLDAPISRIEVSGELDSAERVQVESAIQTALRGGLLSVDLQAIRDELKALSWPRRVSIRRVWPDTLEVDVARALVVAGWGDDYLTIDGQVIQMAGQEHELVHFDCELTAPKTALELYQRLQREVATTGLQIIRLKENALGEWTLTFDNNIKLNVGSSELGGRVGRFVVVYRQELHSQADRVAVVDARYANGIAVRWRAQPELSDPKSAERLAMNNAGQQMRVNHGIR